ncbi:MAG: ribonuclease J [Patescibacteria group bacterium]
MAKFKRSEDTTEDSLRFVPLGGSGRVTRNMFAYESGEDILIVDCGIGFPDFEMLGVDVTIPDITYLKNENRLNKVRGIVLTHAHYDHFGALSHILSEVRVPVYGSRLTLEFVQMVLEEADLNFEPDLREIDPEGGAFELGKFKVTPFRVCHSVPDTVGFCIETPVGNVFHVSDYKFDWTPIDGKIFAVNKVSNLAEEKPLALVSDCLGATNPGYTESESIVAESLHREIEESADCQLFVVTVSSNISRIRQTIESAKKTGRKFCVLGRSMERSVFIARDLGYLDISKKDLVHPRHARGKDQSKLCYLAAGCYGQRGSAIDRISRGEHRDVELEEGARIVFSGDPSPPGARNSVDIVIDELILKGADVSYYDIQENMHVSGHGSAGDTQMLFGLVKPEYFVPIGGSPKYMHAYAQLAEAMGNPSENIFELQEGQYLDFRLPEGHRKDEQIDVTQAKVKRGSFSFRDVLVDGSRVGDVGQVVLHDRKVLSDDGIVVIIVPLDPKTGKISGSVEIVTRGFVYVRESKELLSRLRSRIQSTIDSKPSSKGTWGNLRRSIGSSASQFIAEETGRNPLILSVLVEV